MEMIFSRQAHARVALHPIPLLLNAMAIEDTPFQTLLNPTDSILLPVEASLFQWDLEQIQYL